MAVVTNTGPQLPVTDSHYPRTINYTENTPDFALEAPLYLLLVTFRLLYRFRRALSPYMVQETLMADGSASEVLQTHVQCRGHPKTDKWRFYSAPGPGTVPEE
jgi:hypothetical protein